MKTVLIVCTGNTCRSPMLEGILNARASNEKIQDQVTFASAGIRAAVGKPPTHKGERLLMERGVSIERHRAKQLVAPDLETADLVIVFEEQHRQFAADLVSQELHKVTLLSELAHATDEVDDPFGGDWDAYVGTLETIDSYVNKSWVTLIEKLDIAPVGTAPTDSASAVSPPLDSADVESSVVKRTSHQQAKPADMAHSQESQSTAQPNSTDSHIRGFNLSAVTPRLIQSD